MNSPEKEKREQETYESFFAEPDQVKSLRPRPHKEVYQAAEHDLAIKFMNYLDENRPEGKMCLSNVECEDIDKAFKENDWVKIMRYVEKYSPSWKPSEEQMKALEKYVETQDLNFLKPEIVKRIFKAGAECMAGQGETIDGSLCYDPHLQMVIVFLEDCPKMWEGSIMDVTVQIRKKED